MKVHIYVNPEDVVLISGLMNMDTLAIEPGTIQIQYSGQWEIGKSVMVSMNIDEFVYLQDQDVLVATTLLHN